MTNPILTVMCFIAFVAIWIQAFNSPFRIVIATYLSIQWLQVATKVLVADFLGVDLGMEQIQNYGASNIAFVVRPMTSEAVALGLFALALMSLGTRIFEPKFEAFRLDASNLAPLRLFVGYVLLLIVSGFAGPFVGGGLAQPLMVLGTLRFVFVLLLLFSAVTERRGFWLLAIAIATEIVFGMTGYFAGFRDVIIVVLAGLAILVPKHWYRIKVPIAFMAVFALVIATVWTAVKMDFRQALRGGRSQQAVTIDLAQRFDKLGGLIQTVGPKKFIDGTAMLANRVAYVDIFADAIGWVPGKQPFQGGALWSEAFQVILMPRLIFTDKAPLPSDSARTMKFTGRVYASEKQGTSVSLGYVADSYVDFGIPGALLIPLALGILYGWLSRIVVELGGSRDLTFSLSLLVVMLFPIQEFEISNVKLLPGLLWAWLVACAVSRLIWPALRPYLQVGSSNTRAMSPSVISVANAD